MDKTIVRLTAASDEDVEIHILTDTESMSDGDTASFCVSPLNATIIYGASKTEDMDGDESGDDDDDVNSPVTPNAKNAKNANNLERTIRACPESPMSFDHLVRKTAKNPAKNPAENPAKNRAERAKNANSVVPAAKIAARRSESAPEEAKRDATHTNASAAATSTAKRKPSEKASDKLTTLSNTHTHTHTNAKTLVNTLPRERECIGIGDISPIPTLTHTHKHKKTQDDCACIQAQSNLKNVSSKKPIQMQTTANVKVAAAYTKTTEIQARRSLAESLAQEAAVTDRTTNETKTVTITKQKAIMLNAATSTVNLASVSAAVNSNPNANANAIANADVNANAAVKISNVNSNAYVGSNPNSSVVKWLAQVPPIMPDELVMPSAILASPAARLIPNLDESGADSNCSPLKRKHLDMSSTDSDLEAEVAVTPPTLKDHEMKTPLFKSDFAAKLHQEVRREQRKQRQQQQKRIQLDQSPEIESQQQQQQQQPMQVEDEDETSESKHEQQQHQQLQGKLVSGEADVVAGGIAEEQVHEQQQQKQQPQQQQQPMSKILNIQQQIRLKLQEQRKQHQQQQQQQKKLEQQKQQQQKLEQKQQQQQEQQQQQQKIPKKINIPPLYLPMVDDIVGLLNKLNKNSNIGKFITKTLADGRLRIHCESMATYEAILVELDANNVQRYTHQPRNEKGFRIVVRQLHHSTDTKWLSAKLLEQGFTTRFIRVIRQRFSGKPLNMFEVELQPSVDGAHERVLALKEIGHQHVHVERQAKPMEPPHCHRCQAFGHTKNYCRRSFVCMKCAGMHATTTCSKPRNEPPKCPNCQGEHVGSYRGCPVYKAEVKKMLESRFSHVGSSRPRRSRQQQQQRQHPQRQQQPQNNNSSKRHPTDRQQQQRQGSRQQKQQQRRTTATTSSPTPASRVQQNMANKSTPVRFAKPASKGNTNPNPSSGRSRVTPRGDSGLRGAKVAASSATLGLSYADAVKNAAATNGKTATKAKDAKAKLNNKNKGNTKTTPKSNKLATPNTRPSTSASASTSKAAEARQKTHNPAERHLHKLQQNLRQEQAQQQQPQQQQAKPTPKPNIVSTNGDDGDSHNIHQVLAKSIEMFERMEKRIDNVLNIVLQLINNQLVPMFAAYDDADEWEDMLLDSDDDDTPNEYLYDG